MLVVAVWRPFILLTDSLIYQVSDMPMSVIIITLNEEKNIGRLLDDLQHQTEKDFEVIVVDRNSDDKEKMEKTGEKIGEKR